MSDKKRIKRTNEQMLEAARASDGHLGEVFWAKGKLLKKLDQGRELMGQLSPEARQMLIESRPELAVFEAGYGKVPEEGEPC
jgi:hypothetical protein